MTAWAISLLIPASLAAQLPPPPPQLPPRPPPPPPHVEAPNSNPHGPPSVQGKKPPVGGSMSGLLDYMADVTMDNYEEIDAPVVGYGNELLWEDIKVDPVSSDALLPARTQKRTSRQKKG